MRSLWIVAIAAVLATGCISTTEISNKNEPLTNNSSGTSSGSSGSGTAGSSGGPAPNAAGLMSGFDPTSSVVRGYAYDSNNPSTSFTVELWLDAPRNLGTSLGTVVANVNRSLFPTGPHGFNFTLPMAYQDGKMRQIYVYAIDPNTSARNELGGSPMAFWAGVNLAAKAYFDSTVAPALNAGGGCLGCHQLGGSGAADYLYTKFLIASPDKFNAGSPTNNELINRGVGINHGGGNRCGSVNSGVCALFQTWWTKEFN